MTISILTPSRGRPQGLNEFFKSVNETISGQNKILFIIGLDQDDPLLQTYLFTIEGMTKKAHPEIEIITKIDKRHLLARIWNNLAKEGKGWLTVGNDDYVYLTPGWDVILESYISNINHPYHLFFFDDGLQHGNHCAFPIVSKEWVNALGYFFPEIFHHNYVDTWVFDIAQRLNVWKYIPEVKNQHLHHSINLHSFDKTYKEGNTNNEDDRVMYLSHTKEREAEVEKIKSKIEQWKN